MTALSGPNTGDHYEPRLFTYRMKPGVTIYEGGVVGLVAGLAQPAADVANMLVVGVADKTVTSRASGTSRISGTASIVKLLSTTGLTRGDVGKKVYVVDDQTFTTDASSVSHNIKMGLLREFVSPTQGYVAFDMPAVVLP